MSNLYTRLGKLVSSKIDKNLDNKTVITIDTNLDKKIKDLLDFDMVYLNESNVKIYDNLEVSIREDIEEDLITAYYKTAINILVEMLSVFSFEYDKYLEYQKREYNGFMLYMFTEEFRDSILEFRNSIKYVNDVNLNNILLSIESNIITNMDVIVMFICNSFKHISKKHYTIPLTWVNDSYLICKLVERSNDEKIT